MAKRSSDDSCLDLRDGENLPLFGPWYGFLFLFFLYTLDRELVWSEVVGVIRKVVTRYGDVQSNPEGELSTGSQISRYVG